jgi:superfamily I DNA/RNA helicase
MVKQVIQWSEYQTAIFNEVCHGTDNLTIIARAGASKSTVIIEAINRLSKQRSLTNRPNILVAAFGKAIQKDLESKISKSYISIRTIHSLGLQTLRDNLGAVQIVPNKAEVIARELHEKLGAEDIYLLTKTLGLCKSTLTDTPSRIDELMDRYSITPIDLERERFIKSIVKMMRISKERKTFVDYNDMVWLVNTLCLKPKKPFDICFLDEVQDVGRGTLQVIFSSMAEKHRIIAAGDDLQTLFSFAGIDIDNVTQIQKRLKGSVLTLPISYRCPISVIQLAKTYAKDIKASPNAIQGSIHNITNDKLIDYAKPGCFVLSRNNAAMIKPCMQFIRSDIMANIKGRDIGDGLLYLIKKSKAKTLESFLTWLDAWKLSETKRCLDKARSTAWITDKYECLIELSSDAKNLSDVQTNINKLFKDVDDKDKVVFSTVHQAKGLERENVFLLHWTFHPEKNQEEANIMYVAITRSKNRLYFVDKV